MIIESIEKLKIPCKEVGLEEGKDITKALIQKLKASSNGIGLAAPQVGIYKKVFVAKTNKGYIGFINPKIVKMNKPFIHQNEGCLSFPGLWLNTVRYKEIVIDDLLNGEQTFSQFTSIICQHEVDHLNQILFTERQVPQPYDLCFCNSGKKFKFCHKNKIS